MSTKQTLTDYQKHIVEIYQKEGINSLAGANGDYQLDGKPLLVWFSETTRKCGSKYNNHFNYMKIMDDILFCSQSLQHFTACLYLYRLYINNPLDDAFFTPSGIIYPNLENLFWARYSMFADTASQITYNYWDRIGDTIASFFPDKLEERQVFFPKAIDIIPKDFKDDPNYIWLNKFKENEYKELNGKRKQIVHYSSTNTEFRMEHCKAFRDKSEAQKFQADRIALADFYKNHIPFTFEGLSKTLLLLERISDALF